jgi:hypothetical protein
VQSWVVTTRCLTGRNDSEITDGPPAFGPALSRQDKRLRVGSPPSMGYPDDCSEERPSLRLLPLCQVGMRELRWQSLGRPPRLCADYETGRNEPDRHAEQEGEERGGSEAADNSHEQRPPTQRLRKRVGRAIQENRGTGGQGQKRHAENEAQLVIIANEVHLLDNGQFMIVGGGNQHNFEYASDHNSGDEKNSRKREALWAEQEVLAGSPAVRTSTTTKPPEVLASRSGDLTP